MKFGTMDKAYPYYVVYTVTITFTVFSCLAHVGDVAAYDGLTFSILQLIIDRSNDNSRIVFPCIG